MYVYVCVIISALQLKKPRNRIKLFNQGTYESKWLNSKLRSHDPIFNHLITPHVVSQCLDLEDRQSYNRPVDFDSVEIKAQENYFLKTPKLILIMSRSGDPCTIHWGEGKKMPGGIFRHVGLTAKDRKGPNRPERG